MRRGATLRRRSPRRTEYPCEQWKHIGRVIQHAAEIANDQNSYHSSLNYNPPHVART